MMNNVPIQIIQMIRNGGNPQQIVMSMLNGQTINNPVLQNLLSLAQDGRINDIEAVAKNLMKERGLDYDKEFNAFKQLIGVR